VEPKNYVVEAEIVDKGTGDIYYRFYCNGGLNGELSHEGQRFSKKGASQLMNLVSEQPSLYFTDQMRLMSVDWWELDPQ